MYKLLANIDPVDVNLPDTTADSDTLKKILSFVFVMAGAISVLMVVIGGIRYIISTGDPQKVSTSKNTIIYALVGLIISLSAFVLTNFVLDATKETPTDKSIGYSSVGMERSVFK